ncbi:glycoside hydrolase family 3 protein [Niveomyces insectorum RCEF 264]|uniref:Beta-glucosidase cel3A n=1 Tax=Niveomyces insectorum RCEF 264 TaxID=1081102 RepID=A0A167Z4U1_9HYPO|nr:glycoside hydrolase family 3 protein [Niveomyces insectorum RCEF 264]
MAMATLRSLLLLAAAAALPVEAETFASAADWAAAYTKASAAVAKLSQNDKVSIVTGIGWNKGACVGNTAAIGSVGYPQLCLQDGPLGVRYGTGVTAFTPGIMAAATWDRALMRQRGQFMGEEAKACGVHVLLGPVGGPLGKHANGGRNWEGFGPDPYLTGTAMAETVQGMQGAGIQACAKHFILNEQELNRETMSSSVDDRTMHELYLWPFADAVHAGVASVMCSYNKVNGTWACENKHIMDDLLKDELGFQGYVMTDWNAQHTTGAANSGLDMTMPGSDYGGKTILWGPQLNSAVSSGQVAKTRLDDMAKRILAAWYLVGQDAGYPAINIRANVQGTHKENVRAVARDGIVLLKNDGGALPLAKPKKLAVVGSAAVANPQGINACRDQGCDTGALGMGWGSGTASYPYFVAPYDALKTRAAADGTQLSLASSDATGSVAGAVQGADAAVVFLTADSGEGYITVERNAGDRNDLDPWHNGNALVAAVAAANPNTIVVVHSVGPVLLESILAHAGVKAVVWAGLPSQESGNALVDVLYGDTAPSGKLPYTIAKTAADYGTTISRGDDNFAEGLYIDYRHFDQKSIEPRFEFGFGLSYTNFSFAGLQVTATATSGPATGTVAPGGKADLFDTVATVTCNITNTGSVAGAEVPQLYLTLPTGAPAAPPKQLRGFDKVKLAAGAAGTVTFNLRRKDLSYWDVAKGWVVPTGTFTVWRGEAEHGTDGGALPLAKPKKLAVVGSAAVANPQGINACRDQGCDTGALGMGWGSGTASYPYFVAPYDALKTRAAADGTQLSLASSDATGSVAGAVQGADAAVVFLTADSGEGYITVERNAGDRNDLDPWHNGNALVAAVAAANPNTIVVVHSVGPVLLESILAHAGVKAVVWAGLPSQESGNALVDVLYGDTAPSGKLPYTIAKTAADYGTTISRGDDNFAEGLYIDYRHFDQKSIEPRFEFGFGLSYTNFSFAGLQVTATATSGPATGTVAPGGKADLFDTVATVTCNITNTGSVAGAEVPQLYLTLPTGAPAAPPKQLRGFDKVKLAAGAAGTVTFNLRRKDLSYWDVAKGWVVPTGTFTVSVGASSRDLPLKGTFDVA